MKIVTYKIIRYYKNKTNKIIKTGLSLKDAQKHCTNPNTEKDLIFFDGYTEE